ncbi:MAG: glycoside hydrolase family 97 protein [Cytophagales bacterium]|nr:MAG: glycoside hydrolase family 97 protein [Cytophagales bacterium]
MKKIHLVFAICIGSIIYGCNKTNQQTSIKINSPDSLIEISFLLNDTLSPIYKVTYKGKTIIDSSSLGFTLKDFPNLAKDFQIDSSSQKQIREVWKPVLGQYKYIKNHCNELAVYLSEKSNSKRKLYLYFRAFDEGVAFRYEIPKQAFADSINIISENTYFNLTGDHTAWWNEAHYDSYEIMYNTTPISAVRDLILNKQTKSEAAKELYMKNFGAHVGFNTPLTMRTQDSIYIAFHEANLTNYAEMTLALETGKPFNLRSELVPWPDGIKVKSKLPLVSPWRTIHISDNAASLPISYMEESLNPPSVIEDESYIQPIKYIGVWWGYHIGKYAWDPRGKRGIADGANAEVSKQKPHGASTTNCKKYIDFASKNNINYLLIEGWNPTNYTVDSVDNFLHSHPDFDLQEVVNYGKSKNVEIVIHNESMGQALNLERQADSAFARYKKFGISAMKIGWAWHLETKNFTRSWGNDSASVANYTGGKYFQHSQWAVMHYRKILETAAKYNQRVALHEYVKETGIRRTYPNLMALEGLRGNEYNPWDKGKGNLPEHVTIIPFTRQLAGPIDFTPGIFDLLFDKYKKPQRVNSTLAYQLALYVVFYSPMAMAADLPENYENHPAFQFIKDVPTNWDTTIVKHAAIGDYVSIARKYNNAWYVGAVTDENARNLSLNLDFLDNDKTYQMIQYADAPNTSWETNPTAYEILKSTVKKGDIVNLKLATGGGQAISIVPLP